jgi:hypothetical protein
MTFWTDPFTRIFENLAGRLGGPLSPRFIMQPTMALIFAVRDGIRDARQNRPPFLDALFMDPSRRRQLLRCGWKSVGKIFILALVLDAVYQIIVLHWIYPGEAMIVAGMVALVPYVVFRGPVNRMVRKFRHPQ